MDRDIILYIQSHDPEEQNKPVCQSQLVGRISTSSKWAPEGDKNSVECAGRGHLPGERLSPLYNWHEEKETP